MVARVATRKFTVDEFHRMAEAGILNEDDRLELLDGQIVEMAPIGDPHALTVDRLNRVFVLALQGLPVLVRVQNPVRLSDDTELYPDISIVTDRGDEYWHRGPVPSDCLLLVEVADTTLNYDRRTKALRYARAGVSELWIVNLTAGVLEVFTSPTAAGYSSRAAYRRGESIAPSAFPDNQIGLDQFLR